MNTELEQLAQALAACMRDIDTLEIATNPHLTAESSCHSVIEGRKLLNKLYAAGKIGLL